MHILLSKHFKKPEGILGRFVSKLLLNYNKATYETLGNRAELSDDLNLFEIGYGPGYGVIYLCSKYKLNYSGIDFSKLMHKQATKRVKKKKLQSFINLDFGDFLNSEYPEAEQDRVIFSNVTYFWDDLNLPFSKIHKMLKAGGKLIFCMSSAQRLKERDFTSTEHFIHHEIEDVEKVLNNVGFTKIDIEEGKEEHTGRYIVSAEKTLLK